MDKEELDLRLWFKRGKEIPSLEKQYTYFSDGFRKGETYRPWAWAGIGLVWLQKGNAEGAVDAFEKALAKVPDLPGIAKQLQIAREKAGAQHNPVPDAAPTEQARPEEPRSPPITSETSSDQATRAETRTAETDEEKYARAEALIRQKKNEEAEVLFREILKNSDQNTSLAFGKAAARLAVQLIGKHGKRGEIWQLAHDALVSAEPFKNLEAEFWAHYAIVQTAIFWGLRDLVLPAVEKLRIVATQLGDDKYTNFIYFNISMDLAVGGFYSEGLNCLQEGIESAINRNDTQIESALLNNRLCIYSEMGRVLDAFKDAQRVLDLDRKRDPANLELFHKMQQELVWYIRMTTEPFDFSRLKYGGMNALGGTQFPSMPNTVDNAMQCIYALGGPHGMYPAYFEFTDPRGRVVGFLPSIIYDEVWAWHAIPDTCGVFIIEQRGNKGNTNVWQGQFPQEPTIRDLLGAFLRGEDLREFKGQMLHIMSDHPLTDITPEIDAHLRRRRLLQEPTDWLTAAHMAFDLMHLDDQTGATKCMELVCQQASAPTEAHRSLATLYSLAHDHTKAIAEYEIFLQKNPGIKEVWARLAETLLELKPPACDRAIVACKKALKIDPKFNLATYLLARAEQMKGNWDESEALLKPITGLPNASVAVPPKETQKTTSSGSPIPPNMVRVKDQFYKVDTKKQFLELNSLRIQSISEIEGLDQLVNLRELELWNNSIKQIKGLDSLQKLKVLKLHNNQIEKIEGLTALPQLEELILGENKIKKIENLEGLSSLRVLHLDANRITKIEGLQTLNSLEELYLGSMGHIDITTFDGKTGALVSHDVGGNSISRIEGLDGLQKLKRLHLAKLGIQKLEGLQSLVNLEWIDLEGNALTRIEGLESLVRLNWINLDNNNITRIEGLDSLTQLESLYLSENPISEVEGLAHLSKLKTINLFHTQVLWTLNQMTAQDLVAYCRKNEKK